MVHFGLKMGQKWSKMADFGLKMAFFEDFLRLWANGPTFFYNSHKNEKIDIYKKI